MTSSGVYGIIGSAIRPGEEVLRVFGQASKRIFTALGTLDWNAFMEQVEEK